MHGKFRCVLKTVTTGFGAEKQMISVQLAQQETGAMIHLQFPLEQDGFFQLGKLYFPTWEVSE